MSNLLACILVCISERQKHDKGIKEMCSTGIQSFEIRSKLLQSCSKFVFKTELDESTVIACLAGRDAQEVLYTGLIQKPSGDSRQLQFLLDICNANIHKTTFSAKTYTVKPVLSGHRIKRTLSIKRTVAEVPQFFSLIFFK